MFVKLLVFEFPQTFFLSCKVQIFNPNVPDIFFYAYLSVVCLTVTSIISNPQMFDNICWSTVMPRFPTIFWVENMSYITA